MALKNLTDKTCTYCGMSGHRAGNCPKRKVDKRDSENEVNLYGKSIAEITREEILSIFQQNSSQNWRQWKITPPSPHITTGAFWPSPSDFEFSFYEQIHMTNDEAFRLIDELMPYGNRLQPKEAEFVDSVYKQISEGKFISDRQAGWLHSLHKRFVITPRVPA